MKATEILNVLKTNNDIELVMVDNKSCVYCGSSTGNISGFYAHEGFYGVYSDLSDYGQVDSRKSSDEKILETIEKVLSYDKNAKVVNRKEAVNFNKTYMW